MKILFAVLVAALPAPTSAALYCDVLNAPAGFVGLRAAPDSGARLIAKMHVGDEVLADGGVQRKGDWYFAKWWRGGRFKFKHTQGYDSPSGRGWVDFNFIARDCG